MRLSAESVSNRKFRLGPYIVQIVVWRLPEPSAERLHGLKYSLFFGRPGERIIGYDNERGKGDHRHYGNREETYSFETLPKLLLDFFEDVERFLRDERA